MAEKDKGKHTLVSARAKLSKKGVRFDDREKVADASRATNLGISFMGMLDYLDSVHGYNIHYGHKFVSIR